MLASQSTCTFVHMHELLKMAMASSSELAVSAFIGNIPGPPTWKFQHVQAHFQSVGLPVPIDGNVFAGK